MWSEQVEIHRWDVQGQRHTDTRTDTGFQLRNDEGVLLRFRVEQPKERQKQKQPTAHAWVDDLNTLGRKARRYLALEEAEMESVQTQHLPLACELWVGCLTLVFGHRAGGDEIAEGGRALVELDSMEQQAQDPLWANLPSGGNASSAMAASGDPRGFMEYPLLSRYESWMVADLPFDESLRVMDAGSRVRFESLSKEVSTQAIRRCW